MAADVREGGPVWELLEPTAGPDQLERLPEGRLTVVFHSIFWRYPPEAVRAGISTAIEAAAERCELRLRTRPGDGEDRLLARGRRHYAPIDWLG